MRSIMTANNSSSNNVNKTPQVFTDEELSEIFQINFAEIFGTSTSFPDEKKNAAESSKNTVPPVKKNHINNSKGTYTMLGFLPNITEIFILLRRQH